MNKHLVIHRLYPLLFFQRWTSPLRHGKPQPTYALTYIFSLSLLFAEKNKRGSPTPKFTGFPKKINGFNGKLREPRFCLLSPIKSTGLTKNPEIPPFSATSRRFPPISLGKSKCLSTLYGAVFFPLKSTGLSNFPRRIPIFAVCSIKSTNYSENLQYEACFARFEPIFP